MTFQAWQIRPGSSAQAEVQQLQAAIQLSAATTLADRLPVPALAATLGQQGLALQFVMPSRGFTILVPAPWPAYAEGALPAAMAMPVQACFCLVNLAWLQSWSGAVHIWLSEL